MAENGTGNNNEQRDTSASEEERSSGEIITTDDDQDYYVIIRGKESGDTGVYGTWAETAAKVHNVPSTIHKKCRGAREAKEYLRKGGIAEEEIQHHLTQIEAVKKSTRKLRRRGKVDYKKLSGERNTKPKERRKPSTTDHDDQIIVIKEVTEAIQQRNMALDELEATKRELQENIERYDRDEEEIKKLMK